MTKNSELYTIGCVGKINSFTETNDGRFVINLIGKNYFNLTKKLASRNKFILANVKIISKKTKNYDKHINNFNKELLIEKYKKYIQTKNIQVDTSFIEEINSSDLIKFIAMSCPFTIEDKQMLLETFEIVELGEKILNLLEFYLQNTGNKTVN